MAQFCGSTGWGVMIFLRRPHRFKNVKKSPIFALFFAVLALSVGLIIIWEFADLQGLIAQ